MWRGSLRRARELPALALLLIALVWLPLARPAFRSPDNLAVVAQEAGILGIMACGEALVILTGGIDLSIASVLALSACVGGSLMMNGVPWPLAAILALVTGAGAGWVNGAMVTHRKLPPILVTLATLLLFRGLTNVTTGAAPFNILPAAFTLIGKGFVPFWAFLLVAGASGLMLARSRFGRRVVAVGGSETATRLSGVPVGGVLRRAYLTAGLCAAVAGLLMSAANGNAQWNLADGWELDVIAAVVIGGVRLTGGEGSIVGAGIGALIIVVMRNALFLSGVPTEQYGLITGAVILLAALAEQWRRTADQRA